MHEFAIVMTTCADSEKARPIIDALLEAQLAACVQAMPIQSHYLWNGATQHEEEVLLLIKGKADNFEKIKETILTLNEYDLPEIIQIPITTGLAPYLSWLSNPEPE